MNQFKRAQVIMLPANIAKSEYNQLWLDKNGTLYNATAVKSVKSHEDTKFQELYIISDDKIKDRDWYYNSLYNEIYQCNNKEKFRTEIYVNNKLEKVRHKKIIATTDTSLKRAVPQEQLGEKFNDYYPLPQPSQQFIEKYIEEYNKSNVGSNNFTITDVLVEYENYTKGNLYGNPMMIKPEVLNRLKLNPKDNTITIKKVKNIFTLEDMKSAFDAGMNCPIAGATFEEWIKINL